MSRTTRFSIPAALLVLGLLPRAQTQADYRALTNTRNTFTNYNPEVVRGMAVVDTQLMYAIHAYQSTVIKFAPFYVESERWNTLTSPVSVAVWDEDVFVVCQSSNALVRHAGDDGRILDVLSTLSEPADLVIDHDNGWAYVSCMGSDAVLRVDLAAPMRILDVWSWNEGLTVKRPRFLHLDRRDPEDPADNVLFVAPLVSGNNTLITEDANDPTLNNRILGLDGSAPPGQRLPDEDLFLIDPQATGQQVFAMATGVGSILTAHGLHPSGDYWMLNVNHRNADTLGEPAARGVFADNRVTIIRAADLPLPGGTPAGPATHAIVDVDDLNPATNDDPGFPATYLTQRSVPFPYALFLLPNGGAAIASSMNDLISVVDDNGDRVFDVLTTNVSQGIRGTIVREMLFNGPYFLVYCQGTSNILVYLASISSTEPIAALELGIDPSPPAVRAGRDIWYDGRLSQDGRTSCNTCHPQGLADGLAWEISDLPREVKGPMATQTLCGIGDSGPYHWRGERQLADFNVFRELLGGPANLDEVELGQFMAFILSLTCPANPVQYGPTTLDAGGRLVLDLERKIKTSLTPWVQGAGDPDAPATLLVGNPLEGDRIFHEVNTDDTEGSPFVGSCVSCHANPTGSNGDWFPDSVDRLPSKSNIEVIQLDNQLTLKRQPLVSVMLPNGDTVVSQLLGFGSSHSGNLRGTFDFVNKFFGPNVPPQPNDLSDAGVADVNAFLDVFDNGLAPSAQWAVRLHETAAAGTASSIQAHLLDQAVQAKSWVGVGVLGLFPVNGTLERVRWYYDASQQLFVPDDPTLVGPQPFASFTNFNQTPKPDNVFFGVAPGNERRATVDGDNDGLDLAQELFYQCDPWNPDSDGDGKPDGYEVAQGSLPNDDTSLPIDNQAPTLSAPPELDFANASLAKFFFRTSEPATWELSVSTPGGQRLESVSTDPDTIHTAIVQGLEPSTVFLTDPMADKVNTFTGTLVLIDLAGNRSPAIQLGPFDSGTLAKSVILPQLDQVTVGKILQRRLTSGPYKSLVQVRVDWRENGPPAIPSPGQVVVGQLVERDANGLDWNVVPGSQISTNATARNFYLWPEGQLWGGGVDFQSGDLLVMPPTNASGLSTVRFSVLNGDGKEFQFNVMAIVPASHGILLQTPIVPGYDPLQPAFQDPVFTNLPILFRWVAPATMLAKKRAVEFVQM